MTREECPNCNRGNCWRCFGNNGWVNNPTNPFDYLLHFVGDIIVFVVGTAIIWFSCLIFVAIIGANDNGTWYAVERQGDYIILAAGLELAFIGIVLARSSVVRAIAEWWGIY